MKKRKGKKDERRIQKSFSLEIKAKERNSNLVCHRLLENYLNLDITYISCFLLPQTLAFTDNIENTDAYFLSLNEIKGEPGIGIKLTFPFGDIGNG